jgi:hypothetical protein
MLLICCVDENLDVILGPVNSSFEQRDRSSDSFAEEVLR